MAVRILAFVTLVVLTSCVASCAPSQSPAAVGSVSAPRNQAAAVSAASQISAIASAMQNAYRASDWPRIRALFSDHKQGAAFADRMRRWQDARVHDIHVALTYLHQAGARRYIGTFRFSADPRATPIYAVYIFQTGPQRATVAGSATGVTGSYFTRASWSVTRSKHFVVYHSPYELQGSDHQYLDGLEYERQLFESKFGVRVSALAAYYLYPDTSLMGRLTAGACGSNPENVGCTNPYTRPPTIHSSVWPTYHEPIHVYELALEPRPHGTQVMVAPLFIGEGTAVALQDRDLDPRLSDYCSNLVYIPLDECAALAVSGTRPLDLLSDRGFKRSDAGSAYSLSGSFVKYLILQYGYRSFGAFYYKLAAQPKDAMRDYNVATYAVYHRSITQLLHAWQIELCRSGCP